MKTKNISVALAVPVLMLLVRCGTDNIAGNGTQTGNPTVVGTLYEPDGKTPAAGVRVVIRPKKTLADTSGTGLTKRLAAVDSVTTDSAGRFAFDSTLDTGTYVIEAASGNDAVLIDSVAVTAQDSTDSLPPDTLKPAGALKGVIKLSEGGDPRKVFVLAFGIDRFARVEADGRFRFQNLAEAAYSLRIISSLDDYGVLDTVGVPVRSADTTNLDTISLPFTGIPTPRGLTISYDTLKQIVTLTWNKADSALVVGYNVYRRNVDSNTVLARINTSPITDTVYRDSSGLQDQTYEYWVAAVDRNITEGTKSIAVTVKTVPVYSLADSIGVALFQGYQVMKIAPSGRIYVADILSSSWKMYVFDSSLALAHTIDTLSVRYPASFDVDSAGNIYLINQDGVFKLDSIGAILDTITTWHNAENKTLRLYKGSLFAVSGQVRRYSLNGVLKDSTGMIGADGLVVLRDTVFIGGSGSELRMLDTNLTAIGNWQVAFEENEIAWSLTKDDSGNLFVSGYHYNPSSFMLLSYDPQRLLKSKLRLPTAVRHMDAQPNRLLLAANGRILVYRVR